MHAASGGPSPPKLKPSPLKQSQSTNQHSQLQLDDLLTLENVRIKERIIKGQKVNKEDLIKLLNELNLVRSSYPLFRDNIRLIHRVRKELNPISGYLIDAFPPFLTLIEHEDKNTSLHPMNVAKTLFLANIEGIKEVKSKGRNKIGINFDNPNAANNFVESEALKDQHFKKYIPQSMLYCRGVIRNVGNQITEEDFIKYGFGTRGAKKIRIIDATRFNIKINEDGCDKIVPGSTMLLLFEGTLLPQEVKIFHSIRTVQPYVRPVIICHNCCKFGHHKGQCRNSPKCINCGGSHLKDDCMHGDEASAVKKCPNCEGDHEATSKQCKEYIRQGKINKVVAERGINFFEANKLFPKNLEGSQAKQVDIHDFPDTLDSSSPFQKNFSRDHQKKQKLSYAEQAAKRLRTNVIDQDKVKTALFPSSSRVKTTPLDLTQSSSPLPLFQPTQEHIDNMDTTIDSSQNSLDTQRSYVEEIIGTKKEDPRRPINEKDIANFMQEIVSRKEGSKVNVHK